MMVVTNFFNNLQNFDAAKFVCACTEDEYLSDASRSSQDFYLHFELCSCLPSYIVAILYKYTNYAVRKTRRILGRQEDNCINFMQLGRQLHFSRFFTILRGDFS